MLVFLLTSSNVFVIFFLYTCKQQLFNKKNLFFREFSVNFRLLTQIQHLYTNKHVSVFSSSMFVIALFTLAHFFLKLMYVVVLTKKDYLTTKSSSWSITLSSNCQHNWRFFRLCTNINSAVLKCSFFFLGNAL